MSKSLTSYFPRTACFAINPAGEGTQTFSGGNGKCIFLFGLALLPETEGWATTVVYTYRLSVNTAGWCVLPLVVFFSGYTTMTEVHKLCWYSWQKKTERHWIIHCCRRIWNSEEVTPQMEREKKRMLRKATKVYVYIQCFSLFFKL